MALLDVGVAPPAWFQRAVGAAPEHHALVSDGARVNYRVWGTPGLPGLVLVHGGAAHSGWWDHVAPQLAGHRVVALDLTGHGDSDWRDTYGMDHWVNEVAAVCAAEQLERPVVVGHSLGGFVAVSTGVAHPDAVAAVVVIDSPLNDQPPEEARLRERRRPKPVYPSADEAVARFVTLPPQDLVLPYVRDHVAHQSVRQVEGGWTWKFHPSSFGTSRQLMRDLLPQLQRPVALFRSEHGLVSPAMAQEMARLMGGRLPVVDLADAGHHPMLDQPLALVAGLRTLLALWPEQ